MKSTVVDESLSSFKPMYCSREYQASTRLSQQYEKPTFNWKYTVLVEAHDKLGHQGNTHVHGQLYFMLQRKSQSS